MMAVCQPGTMVMPKIHDTTVCTVTTSMVSHTAMMFITTFRRRCCFSLPVQPKANISYSLWRNEPTSWRRSRHKAMSGIKAK